MNQYTGPRKSCDVCYNKKIKCDGQKPRCSHCVVYDKPCTFRAARRSASRKQPRAEEPVLSRVEQLEARLAEVAGTVAKLQALVPQPVAEALPDDGEDVPPEAQGPAMNLPPLEQVLPVVERFLSTFNSVMPLFHPGTLLRTVKNWYWHPHRRSPATWAAINVVLALAHRDAGLGRSAVTGTLAEYLNNALSVLTEVSMQEAELISVQALVGLAMLVQGTEEIGPSAMLIAMAVRQAHRLGLHARRSYEGLDPAAGLQRRRVFWLAYILERDIALRTKQSLIQDDADIDVELPSEEGDGAGLVFTADGRSQMNFFAARVQLAQIQGSVHQCLYSVRAQAWSAEQRAANVARVHESLVAWGARIPVGFSAAALAQADAPPRLLRFFGVLYATRFACLSLASRAHSWDPEWLHSLQEYGEKAAVSNVAAPVVLPHGWSTIVDEARNYMLLFMKVPQKDAAFVCIYNPNHEAAEVDAQLGDVALGVLDVMVRQTTRENLWKVRDASIELVRHARTLLARKQQTPGFAFSQGVPLSTPRGFSVEDAFRSAVAGTEDLMGGSNASWPLSDEWSAFFAGWPGEDGRPD